MEYLDWIDLNQDMVTWRVRVKRHSYECISKE